jgi:hypothetical protein
MSDRSVTHDTIAIERGSVTNYLDVVPDQRTIMAGTMFASELPISCSLATVEFLEHGRATRMIYTEQAAFLDGWEYAAVSAPGMGHQSRQAGCLCLR